MRSPASGVPARPRDDATSGARRLRPVVACLLAVFGCACAPAGEPQRAAPVAFAPLPADAFRIEWAPVRLPITLRPGESRRVTVSFTNASPVAWPADGHWRLYCVRLSHRWQRGVDALPQTNYGERVELPAPVQPGQSVTLTDTVVAPTTPGDYVVQFDLVQAGVSWFAARGAALKLVLVKVQ